MLLGPLGVMVILLSILIPEAAVRLFVLSPENACALAHIGSWAMSEAIFFPRAEKSELGFELGLGQIYNVGQCSSTRTKSGYNALVTFQQGESGRRGY